MRAVIEETDVENATRTEEGRRAETGFPSKSLCTALLGNYVPVLFLTKGLPCTQRRQQIQNWKLISSSGATREKIRLFLRDKSTNRLREALPHPPECQGPRGCSLHHQCKSVLFVQVWIRLLAEKEIRELGGQSKRKTPHLQGKPVCSPSKQCKWHRLCHAANTGAITRAG